MITDDQKESKRFRNAAKSMLRITNWLLRRSGNNLQYLDREPEDLLREILKAGDPLMLARFLDHLRRSSYFDTADTDFERAVYDHLSHDYGTVFNAVTEEQHANAELGIARILLRNARTNEQRENALYMIEQAGRP